MNDDKIKGSENECDPAPVHREVLPCRDEFEDWIISEPFCESIERIPDDPEKFAWAGQYYSMRTQCCWVAWKEAWVRGSQFNQVSK
jgi:hypothetical protein